MLKAIFFDLDDTLYSTSYFSRLARENSIQAMINSGLRIDKEVLMNELAEIITEFSSNYEHHFDKLLLRLPPETYEGLNPALVISSGIVAYHDTKFKHLKPFPDAIELLEKLQNSPVILGIITDGIEIKQAEKLIRLGLVQYFDRRAIFISDQFGINKPNKKLYLRACQDIGIEPHDVMYVGDNELRDIDPPNKIGMITVKLDKGGKYSKVVGDTKPNYIISDFNELVGILRNDFSLKID